MHHEQYLQDYYTRSTLHKRNCTEEFWLFKLCLCVSMHVLTIGQSWQYAFLLWFYPQLPIRCQGKTTTPNYTHIHTHTKVWPGMVWRRHLTRSGCKVFSLFLLLCGSLKISAANHHHERCIQTTSAPNTANNFIHKVDRQLHCTQQVNRLSRQQLTLSFDSNSSSSIMCLWLKTQVRTGLTTMCTCMHVYV